MKAAASSAGSPRGEGAPLLRLGFRPFFVGAGLFAVIGMGVWGVETGLGGALHARSLSPAFWHAHEMVYGYALAVVAGFLLTAVRNWTGVPTPHGGRLGALAGCWLAARVAWMTPASGAPFVAAILDGVFGAWLAIEVMRPVIQARQWSNIGVTSKVVFFPVGHALYAWGALHGRPDIERMGVFIGLYMLLSLILVLARRLLPKFIERGLEGCASPVNRAWVDIACFSLFLAFAVCDVFFDAPMVAGALAAALTALHATRLWGWHAPGIWRKPLLWSLFLAYGWIIAGFALEAASVFAGIAPSLGVHAFTVGGIGLMTLAMMARVSLGHTGRNVTTPPDAVTGMHGLLLACALARVIGPLVAPSLHAVWVALSQAMWMGAFAWFVAVYGPMLARPRLDGRPG